MTDLTAEWCREQASNYDRTAECVASLQANASDLGLPGSDPLNPRLAAALRIAARVLDEQTVEPLARVIASDMGDDLDHAGGLALR